MSATHDDPSTPHPASSAPDDRRSRAGARVTNAVVHAFTLRAPTAASEGARPPAIRTGSHGPAAMAGPAEVAASGPVPKKPYQVLRTTQVDEYDPPVAPSAVPLTSAPVGDNFAGTARKAAKLSISSAAVEQFEDVADLIASLPDHQAMVNHHPRITTASNARRVHEEDRNVRVRAWIYAASRESDNDFHLIVGRDPAAPPQYITMEISGLPPANSPHSKRLKRARRDYKSFFQQSDGGLPHTSYDFYQPPVPVEIEGSLFFDMSHASGGRPGPQDLRPDMPVVWEVHPVSAILFEPDP